MIRTDNNVFIFLCLTPYITLSTLLNQEVCSPRESSFVTQRIERSLWVNSYPKKLRFEISWWEVKGLNRDSWATYKHIWFSYIHNFTKNTLLKFCLLHILSISKYKSVYTYEMYRVFSLTWPGSMQIYWNKRNCLHKKRVQLPQDWFGTPTWPPFHCFGTPIWPPWRHVKTLYI